jgi:uncharacterized protein (DUF305 family)
MKSFPRNGAKLGATLFAVLALVSFSACGSNNDDKASAQHNDQDVTFAEDMIPHHGQAVDMAAMAPERAQNARVKSLAQQIRSAQQPEIDTMNGLLTSWGKKTVAASGEGSAHAGHGESMPGMMSDSDMKKLEATNGATFDRMFLEMMIEHHQGAVQEAEKEVAKGEDTAAKTLAQTIITTQKAEITEMESLLKQV